MAGTWRIADVRRDSVGSSVMATGDHSVARSTGNSRCRGPMKSRSTSAVSFREGEHEVLLRTNLLRQVTGGRRTPKPVEPVFRSSRHFKVASAAIKGRETSSPG